MTRRRNGQRLHRPMRRHQVELWQPECLRPSLVQLPLQVYWDGLRFRLAIWNMAKSWIYQEPATGSKPICLAPVFVRVLESGLRRQCRPVPMWSEAERHLDQSNNCWRCFPVEGPIGVAIEHCRCSQYLLESLPCLPLCWRCPSCHVGALVDDVPIGSCRCYPHGQRSPDGHGGDGGGRCGRSPTCWAAVAMRPVERMLFVLRRGQMQLKTCRFRRSLADQQGPSKAAHPGPYPDPYLERGFICAFSLD